jgi:hypothetical protein
MGAEDRHFTHSTLRERIVEHVFVGDVLRTLWRRGVTDVEILRSEFDAHGYDVVMSRGSVVRHIQFKTQKDRAIKVSLALGEKPSGCVIWIGIDEHLNLKHFRWFGGLPGQPLPEIKDFKVAQRETRNKAGERPDRRNHRMVPKRAFQVLETIDDVIEHLFGKIPAG